MIKSAALIFVLALSILAIAFSSFSLNFDDMTIYPIDGDETRYSMPSSQWANHAEIPLS